MVKKLSNNLTIKQSIKIAFMDNNYNFKINQPPLKQADIEKHKDFDALLKRMEVTSPPQKELKVASRKAYYWISGIAVTLLIGILAFGNLFQETGNSQNATIAYLATQPYVNPPMESLAKKGEKVTVNANEGGTYQFPSGSKMVVPRSAFANSYGALIEGDVEIHFKEYHDYIDFFLSGIPMEIEVDGKAGVLESVGMIEVYATQDGERLQMLPEKPIDIELKSQIAFAGDTPPEFNIYYLDKEKRAWSLEGEDKIELTQESNTQAENITVLKRDELGNIVSAKESFVKVIGDPNDPYFTGEVTYDTTYTETVQSLTLAKIEQNKVLDRKKNKEIKQIERQFKLPTKPEKPEQYDGNSMTMELDFKGEDLGAKNYKGTIWQVMSTIDAVDDFSTTVWTDYDLEKTVDESFTLNLSKGEKAATLKVKPVLMGKNYDQALQQFEAQLANYQKEKMAAEKALVAKKQEIADRIAIEKELAGKDFTARIAALKAKGHTNYATNEIIKRTVLNKFQINRFGTWNCDRPRPPYLAQLDGTFQDQHLTNYKNKMVYHTDKSQNTLRRVYLKDIAKNIQFNKDSKNLIWLVTEENKLAVFPPAYFERIQKMDGEYAFELNLEERVIDSEEDVRAILKL